MISGFMVCGFIFVFVGSMISFGLISRRTEFDCLNEYRWRKNLNLANAFFFLSLRGKNDKAKAAKKLAIICIAHWLALLVGIIVVLFIAVALKRVGVGDEF